MRRFVCRVRPSSQISSRCLPRVFTVSIVRPTVGVGPDSRGAVKLDIGFPTSAVRIAVAVRWNVSPSGTSPVYFPSVGRSRDTRGDSADDTVGAALQADQIAGPLVWLRGPHGR